MSIDSNNLDKYQKLIMQHAHYSDLINSLKAQSRVHFAACAHPYRDYSKTDESWTFGEGFMQALRKVKGDQINCITNAYAATSKVCDDNGELYTFDEIWSELEAEGFVCHHCKELRRLKAERKQASRKLGYVRGAMTKMGRKLAQRGVA